MQRIRVPLGSGAAGLITYAPTAVWGPLLAALAWQYWRRGSGQG
ncbi:hypothetical protein ACGFIF_03160 [Kribbella sp. NPDC049174]